MNKENNFDVGDFAKILDNNRPYNSPGLVKLDLIKTEVPKFGTFSDGTFNASTSNLN